MRLALVVFLMWSATAHSLEAPPNLKQQVLWDHVRLAVAEEEGFEVLVTTDKNMRYQQNLTGRKIAFVVLGNQQWPTLRLSVERVLAAVNAASPGTYTEVEIPFG